MTDTPLWLVIEYDYDSATPHCVFAEEDDADAYAKAVQADVEEILYFGKGESPKVWVGYVAAATVVREPIVHTSHARGKPPVRTVYGNRPPELTTQAFSEFQYVPPWVHNPVELVTCSADGNGLHVEYRGSDRDAVLAACTARYEKALEVFHD